MSAGVGSKDGAGGPQSAASPAAVTEARTVRCGGFSVATTVIIASTTREPAALGVPTLPWRQRTPGRSARSAALCVGSTPACRPHVHRAWRHVSSSRQVPAVVGTPPVWPAASRRSTACRTGHIERATVRWAHVPARTRCHHWHLGRACPCTASPLSRARPPRARLAARSRRRCAPPPCRRHGGSQG